MDIQAFITEVRNDPLARGYSTMSDSALFTSLFTLNRTVERTSLTGAQIYNCVVPSEFTSLTAPQQQTVRDIVGLGGDIDVRVGTNARTALLNIFGAGTATRTNLANTANRTISRAEELGFGDMDFAYMVYLRSINP